MQIRNESFFSDMKILIIDYLSPRGHVKFDRIHINALAGDGVSIDIVGKSNQFLDFKDRENLSISNIPDCLFKNYPLKPLSERLLGILRLLWICLHFKIKDYDAIIFLSYDVLSLSFCRIKGNVFLINHNNVSQLCNSTKLFLTRRLPLNYKHIVLNKYMFKRLKGLLPHKDVIYVPHGIDLTTSSVIKPSFISEEKLFLFCPVNRNYDSSLLGKLLNSEELNKFLKSHNIILYFKKNNVVKSDLSYIKAIDGFLSDGEYNYMLTHSVAVILPYGNDFIYRCSGIFFECVAHHVPVITTSIPDMIEYKENTQTDYFVDVESFISCVEKVLSSSKKDIDVEVFNPQSYWKNIIKGLD